MAEKKNGETGTPTAETKTPAAKTAATISKMEAVRRAINALGAEAGRADLQKYIHTHFKIEMSLDHISNYKGEVARRAGKGKGRRKPGRPKMSKAAKAAKPAVAAKPAAVAKPAAKKPVVSKAPAKAAPAASGAVTMKAIEAAKDLLGLLEPAKAKALIDVLGK